MTAMMKDTAMTDLTNAAPIFVSSARDVEAAAAALAVLEESLAYYTPEAPVAAAQESADTGYVPYYEAA